MQLKKAINQKSSIENQSWLCGITLNTACCYVTFLSISSIWKVRESVHFILFAVKCTQQFQRTCFFFEVKCFTLTNGYVCVVLSVSLMNEICQVY